MYLFDSLEAVNDKFRKLAGSDACANTMEDELDRVLAYVYQNLFCLDSDLIIMWRSQ